MADDGYPFVAITTEEEEWDRIRQLEERTRPWCCSARVEETYDNHCHYNKRHVVGEIYGGAYDPSLSREEKKKAECVFKWHYERGRDWTQAWFQALLSPYHKALKENLLEVMAELGLKPEIEWGRAYLGLILEYSRTSHALKPRIK